MVDNVVYELVREYGCRIDKDTDEFILTVDTTNIDDSWDTGCELSADCERSGLKIKNVNYEHDCVQVIIINQGAV